MVVDSKTGKKANFNSKKTLIESFKTNKIDEKYLDDNNNLKYKVLNNNILKFY